MTDVRTDVWIDTDPAIGLDGCDVDDGLAVVQAFRSPELRIAGVSAVFGNTALERTWPIAQELVARFAPGDTGVHRGAAAAGELGEETDAVRGLARTLHARPLTVLALGPVTNVASLVLRHPELVPRIPRIVCVAARRPGQAFRSTPAQRDPFPDLNFECDPEGMRVLLDSAVPLAFAGWEVASHVWLGQAELDAMAGAGGAAAWLAERCRGWLAMWQRDFAAPGFNPFDTLAVGWVTDPGLLESFAADVRIEAVPGAAAPHLVARPAAGSAARAVYCTRPAARFRPDLLHRLGVPPARC